jgi:metabotropic X receptor
VAELMKAVKRMNATGHFNWIGSDGWSARAIVSEGKTALTRLAESQRAD